MNTEVMTKEERTLMLKWLNRAKDSATDNLQELHSKKAPDHILRPERLMVAACMILITSLESIEEVH